MCAIVGDSIITGIAERQLSKTYRLVKVQVTDLKHYIIPI